MAAWFDDSPIVQEVREHCEGGWNIALEFVKFAIVINVSGKITNGFAAYVSDRQLEPITSMGGIWLIAIGLLSFAAVFYCALWERMRPRDLGLRFSPPWRVLRDLVLGYGVGIVCIGGSFLLALALGGIQTQVNVHNVVWWTIPWMCAVYLFQAFGEEVMYRGAFMMSAVRKNPAWLALLVTSVWFSYFPHHFNGGYNAIAFVNLFLLALVCGMSVFLSGRIWMAGAIHAAWNLFQGNIFGVAVSGNLADPTATLLVSTTQGGTWLSGGEMGLEASVASTIVLAAVAVLFFAFYWRRRDS